MLNNLNRRLQKYYPFVKIAKPIQPQLCYLNMKKHSQQTIGKSQGKQEKTSTFELQSKNYIALMLLKLLMLLKNSLKMKL